VATALLIDANTARSYFERFERGVPDALLRMKRSVSDAYFSGEQRAELDTHLQEQLHQSATSVARWIAETFSVECIVSGLTAALRRLGDTEKKPKLVPGKAGAERQQAHILGYENLQQNKDQGVHPVHGCDSPVPQPGNGGSLD
jgi:transposase